MQPAGPQPFTCVSVTCTGGSGGPFFFFGGGGLGRFGGAGLTYQILKFIHGFRPLYFEITEFSYLFFILRIFFLNYSVVLRGKTYVLSERWGMASWSPLGSAYGYTSQNFRLLSLSALSVLDCVFSSSCKRVLCVSVRRRPRSGHVTRQPSRAWRLTQPIPRSQRP